MVVILVMMIGASHIATKESKSPLSSLSPCMLLSDGRELVGKLGPVDDGDDDYKEDNDDNNEEKNIDNSNNNDNDADDQETSAGSLPHFPQAGASPPQQEPGAHMIYSQNICLLFISILATRTWLLI